jgi:hypothetical protein
VKLKQQRTAKNCSRFSAHSASNFHPLTLMPCHLIFIQKKFKIPSQIAPEISVHIIVNMISSSTGPYVPVFKAFRAIIFIAYLSIAVGKKRANPFGEMRRSLDIPQGSFLLLFVKTKQDEQGKSRR